MSGAAARSQWSVERLASWQVPEHLIGTAPAIYGEPLFVSVVAEPLGVEMIQPAPNWLPSVPEEYRKRRVELVNHVGLITGRGWAIVEGNAAWGSGLYGCDPASVLPVVRRACIPTGFAAVDDTPWLRSSHLNPRGNVRTGTS
jgi:hypothetical protein